MSSMAAGSLESAVPAVSVLLPVFNAEGYVREAIESVLSQSFSDFEVLALDDGSTDRSLSILHQCQAKDARVRVHSRESRGLVATLNELVALAQGKYLARMDSDDLCMPLRLEQQVRFLDSSSEHVAVGGWVERMNEDGLPIGILKPPSTHDEIDQAQLRGFTSIWHPTALVRKNAVMRIGGYRGEYTHAEDLDLWLRLAELGKLASVPEVVRKYRLHSGSVSEQYVQVQIQAAKRACADAWRRREVAGRFEAVEPWRPNEAGARHKFALQYGWVAWQHGHKRTWWAYVCEA